LHRGSSFSPRDPISLAAKFNFTQWARGLAGAASDRARAHSATESASMRDGAGLTS